MARIMGSKTVLWLDDQAGTCRNVSGDLNNIGFNRSVNLPETTTFGDNAVQREITGLMDAGLDCTAIWNTGAIPGITDMLENLYAASAHTRMQYAPAGSTSGSPLYTACVRISQLNITNPVDNLVTATFNLVLASGSVVAACVS